MRIYEVKPRTLPHTAYPLLVLGKNKLGNCGLTGTLMPKLHETIVDYIEQPMRLVSTKMKDILCAHEPRIKTRPVRLSNPETVNVNPKMYKSDQIIMYNLAVVKISG